MTGSRRADMGFDLAAVNLSAIDDDGFIGVQVDVHGDAGMSAFELHHTFGFSSRPRDPDASGACTSLFGYKGNEGFAWLANDPRCQAKLPQVKKGGSLQYAFPTSGLVPYSSFDGDDGTWTLYVPYSQSKAHAITVGLDGSGKAITSIQSGEGPSITFLDRVGTIKNASGNAWVQVDDNGTTVIGALKAYGGIEVGGPAAQPLVKFPALEAALAAVQAALTALGSVAPIAANTGAASALTAAVTALQAFAAAGATTLTKGA